MKATQIRKIIRDVYDELEAPAEESVTFSDPEDAVLDFNMGDKTMVSVQETEEIEGYLGSVENVQMLVDALDGEAKNIGVIIFGVIVDKDVLATLKRSFLSVVYEED